ncbi:unnamed protein product [Pylaiella littoralis]
MKQRLTEETPLVQQQCLQAAAKAAKAGPSSPQHQGNEVNDAGDGSAAAERRSTPPKTRLRRLHSAPIKNFLSTGMDVDSLRLSYAAKLVLAAVEGRQVESAVDLLFLRGGLINPLSYQLYSPILIGIILGHLVLAMWEGGVHPFPLHPAVAAAEVFACFCYATHILLHLWTFGVKQYRDKKWHFAFTVLAIVHSVLMVFAAAAAHRAGYSSRAAGTAEGGEEEAEQDWWNAPRLALLGAHALRPMMLISNLRTIRRVFTNVLRQALPSPEEIRSMRTGSILMLGAVVLSFYSVLGINLFNSEQVRGYSEGRDNFDNFGGALLSLFVLVTEENFPEVADPSFTQRPLVAYPFFVSFLLLFLVVILPLLLGIVLDAYAQQHAGQHERYRRKARNALLAAYHILDDDGLEGLSRDQLVGVLTTEAGIGIDTEKAEKLWHLLLPAGHERDNMYQRSSSAPVANDRTPSRKSSTAPRHASGIANTNTTSSSSSGGGGGSDVAGGAFRGGGRGGSGSSEDRVGVLAFLRLADLLHERVVETGEDDDDGDAGGGNEGYGGATGRRGGGCYMAGYDDDNDVVDSEDDGINVAHGAGRGCGEIGCGGGRRMRRMRHRALVRGRAPRGDGFREEEEDDEKEDSQEGSQEDSQEDSRDDEEQCCFWGDGGVWKSIAGETSDTNAKGSGSGGGSAGVRDGDVGAPFSASQRMRQCVLRALEKARKAARVIVGQAWFFQISRGIAVLLTMLALAWTPRSQQVYDGCVEEEREDCTQDKLDFRREDLLRRLNGLVLLAFFAEMMIKVLAVGCRGLWRLYWAHRFDLIVLGVCVASYLFVGVPGNRLALFVDRHPGLSDVMELPRAMVVLRLLTVFPQMRRLLETMSTVAAMLVKIMVLYSCVSYSFAAVGMAIFANAKSDTLLPRYSFSSLPEACLALFFMTVSNNWNDLLYPLVMSVRGGRWSAIYMVSYMLFCAIMMLDVLTGVVIEGFKVSKRSEQAPRLPSALEKSPGTEPPGGQNHADSDSRASTGDEDDSQGTDRGVSPDGQSQQQQQQQQGHRAGSRRGMLGRKASSRKYTQVKAEDMFRPEAQLWKVQGVWDDEDLRELDQAVKTVEWRLHQAWVSHIRQIDLEGESV